MVISLGFLASSLSPYCLFLTCSPAGILLNSRSAIPGLCSNGLPCHAHHSELVPKYSHACCAPHRLLLTHPSSDVISVEYCCLPHLFCSCHTGLPALPQTHRTSFCLRAFAYALTHFSNGFVHPRDLVPHNLQVFDQMSPPPRRLPYDTCSGAASLTPLFPFPVSFCFSLALSASFTLY